MGKLENNTLSDISQKNTQEQAQTIEEIKKAVHEEATRKELAEIGYGFIERHDGKYLLQKDGSYNRPKMENYSETLDVEIDDLNILPKLAKLIKGKVDKFEEDLLPYSSSDFLTKGLFLGDSDAPKNIYNKETFFGSNKLNPDSTIITFDEIADIFGIVGKEQINNKDYINSIIYKIIHFLEKIKIDEKAYKEKQKIAKQTQKQLDKKEQK